METPRKNLIRMLVPTSEVRDTDNSDTDSPGVLHGDLAVFNNWTEISSMWEGNFLERIAPGAFDKTLRERRNQFKVLLNHGMDYELGQKPLGSITDLRATDKSVPYKVQLFRGIPPLVIDGLRAGEYGSSFQFDVVDDTWDKPKSGLPRRTINEVRLYEFGPVTFPAYQAASAGVRSQGDMLVWQRLTTDEERAEFVRFLMKATSADDVTEAGEERPEPEVSTPFAQYRELLLEWKEKGYEQRAH